MYLKLVFRDINEMFTFISQAKLGLIQEEKKKRYVGTEKLHVLGSISCDWETLSRAL